MVSEHWRLGRVDFFFPSKNNLEIFCSLLKMGQLQI